MLFTCLKRQESKHEGIIRKKIVIVGDGECGKTCLLWRFSKATFRETEYQSNLFEADVTKVHHENTEVELVLFDTAGQDDYSQLRHVSYPGADVIIICFALNHPDSLNNVSTKWWPEILHYCQGVPILLVGTKKDLRDEHINSSDSIIKNIDTMILSWDDSVQFEHGQAVAEKIGACAYMECSAKLNMSVESVFREVTKVAVSSKRKRKPCLP